MIAHIAWNRLTKEEQKMWRELNEKMGCPGCGAVGIGVHFCPGPPQEDKKGKLDNEDVWKTYC